VIGERDRERVRTVLLDRARADAAISGAAVTGSAARGSADRWSDIDLFLAVADGHDPRAVLERWSGWLYGELGALHHFDLTAGAAVYRAFLLDDLCEVDLGFAPQADFGPVGDGGFRTVFGSPAPPRAGAVPDPDHLAGLGWHHARHARVCVERAAWWQAEHWISALRDHTLTLACLRLDLPAHHAKGADRLPRQVTAPLADALVRELTAAELLRALAAAVHAFLAELSRTAPATADALRPTLLRLAGPGPLNDR
jgi:hypothetical protein